MNARPHRIVYAFFCVFLLVIAEEKSRAEEFPAPAPLRSVGEVLRLTREEAAKNPPVRIEGVLTYDEPQMFLTFLWDKTGGIYISTESPNLRAGDRVVVEGVAGPGSMQNHIIGAAGKKATVRVLSHGNLPAAEPVNLAEGAVGAYDAHFVEVHVLVGEISRQNDRAILETGAESGSMAVVLPGYGEGRELPTYLRGVPATIRGVFGASKKESGKMPTLALYVVSQDEVKIDPQFVTRALEKPRRTYGELYSPSGSGRITTAGAVTLIRPGRGFFMAVREKGGWGGNIWVQTTQPLRLKPDQMVDVLGVVEMSNHRPQIRDAIVRPGEMGGRRTPTSPPPREMANGDHHAELVKLTGVLLEQQRGLEEDALVLSMDGEIAYARLPLAPGGEHLPKFGQNSRLAVTGVCVARGAEMQPLSFQIWLRDNNGVKVISPPPWWTKERVVAALAFILILAAAVLGWAMALKSQVSRQTTIIREQVIRESIHEERTRIAREFHDTIEQHLAAIGMQLDAVDAASRQAPPPLHELVRTARDIVRHSREEARQAIWDLRAPYLGRADFPQTLEEQIRPLTKRAGLHLEITTSGEATPLPPRIEHHLLRLAQETLTNTIKHAAATAVQMEVEQDAAAITLRISDNGRGFAPSSGGPETGHFGLCGMRERVDWLNGSLEVNSRAGGGVVVTVWLPLDNQC